MSRTRHCGLGRLRRTTAVFTAFVATITLAGCGAGSAGGDGRLSLNIGVQSLILQTYYPQLAEKLGYFDDENLEVNITVGENTATSMQALLGGSIDAYLGGADGISATQQGANLKFVAAGAIRPPVLLMDEPFSALDAQTQEKLQRDLQRVVAETATTTIFITHDIREAVFQADRVFVLAARPGRFVKIYDIDEPRPRRAEFQQSDRLAELAREIWGLLHHPKSEAVLAAAASNRL